MMRAPAPYWFLASPYVEMRADIQGVLERARKFEQAPAGLDTVLDWFGHVSRQIHQAPRGGNAHFRDALNHLHRASQELNVVLEGSSGCGLLSVAALLVLPLKRFALGMSCARIQRRVEWLGLVPLVGYLRHYGTCRKPPARSLQRCTGRLRASKFQWNTSTGCVGNKRDQPAEF